ncbi:MAG: hypothetical protein AB1772_13335, partial [Candidatus Zixiibacteriota bacterium]
GNCRFKLTGLQNGTAFYVTVAAYDKVMPQPHEGPIVAGIRVQPDEIVPWLASEVALPTWGRAIEIRGDRAYVTFGNCAGTGGLAVVDISNPDAMSVTQQTVAAAMTCAWNVRVRDRYAYVVDGNTGLRTVELTYPGSSTGGTASTLVDGGAAWTVNRYVGRTVKISGGTGAGQSRTISSNDATTLTVSPDWATAPDNASRYEIDSMAVIDTTHPTAGLYKSMEMKDDYIYVVEWDTSSGFDGRIQIFSISNGVCGSTGLSKPGYCGALQTKIDCTSSNEAPGDVAVQGDRLFVSAHTYAKNWIYDVTVPTAPASCATFDAAPGGVNQGVAVSGKHAVVSTPERVAVYDVSNTASVVALGAAAGLYDGKLPMLAGGYVFLSSTDQATNKQSVDILALRDPSFPRRVGTFTASSNPFADMHSSRVAVAGNYLFVPRLWALSAVRLTLPIDPRTEGTFGEFSTSYSYSPGAVSGNVLYGNRSGRLVAVDINNPASPAELGNINVGGQMAKIVPDAGLVHVAKGFNGGVSTYRQLETGTFALAGTYAPAATSIYKMAARWPYLYAYCASTTAPYPVVFKVIDVRTFSQVGGDVALSAASTSDELHDADVAINGPYAYVTDGTNGVYIVWIGRPGLPTLVKNIPAASMGGGTIETVKPWGSYLHVATSIKGKIYDHSDPENPVFLADAPFSRTPVDVAVSGAYAYYATGGVSLQTVDLWNPASPVLLGETGEDWNPFVVVPLVNHTYVISGTQAQIFRMR